MTKTWLITGCSSGFGKVLAEAVLARGDQLVATARSADPLGNLVERYPDTARTAALDVTGEGSAAAAVALAEEAFGRLDIPSTMPVSASWAPSRRRHRKDTGQCSRPTSSA